MCCSALRREGGVLLAPSSDKRERVNGERGRRLLPFFLLIPACKNYCHLRFVPGRVLQPALHCATKLPSSERGAGPLALSLDGADGSFFFLLFFATGANLCWRRLARTLPAKACILLCEPGASARTIYSDFPVSLLSLLGGRGGSCVWLFFC